jgi:hypothetical protein
MGGRTRSNANYVNAVTAAANALVNQRFLLPEDVATYVTPAMLQVIPTCQPAAEIAPIPEVSKVPRR